MNRKADQRAQQRGELEKVRKVTESGCVRLLCETKLHREAVFAYLFSAWNQVVQLEMPEQGEFGGLTEKSEFPVPVYYFT